MLVQISYESKTVQYEEAESQYGSNIELLNKAIGNCLGSLGLTLSPGVGIEVKEGEA